jgi:hypothetical protein
MAKRTKTPDTFTFEELCAAVGLKASYKGMNDLVERNHDYIFGAGDYAYKQATKDGEDEDKAEEARQEAEMEASDEISTAYIDAAIETIENQLTEHFALDLTEVKGRKNEGMRFKIAPLRTWRESLGQIVETINGVGYYRFDSIREFLNSGPYTEREGVLTHLHYLSDYGRVYGDKSLQREFEDNLSHKLRY